MWKWIKANVEIIVSWLRENCKAISIGPIPYIHFAAMCWFQLLAQSDTALRVTWRCVIADICWFLWVFIQAVSCCLFVAVSWCAPRHASVAIMDGGHWCLCRSMSQCHVAWYLSRLSLATHCAIATSHPVYAVAGRAEPCPDALQIADSKSARPDKALAKNHYFSFYNTMIWLLHSQLSGICMALYDSMPCTTCNCKSWGCRTYVLNAYGFRSLTKTNVQIVVFIFLICCLYVV